MNLSKAMLRRSIRAVAVRLSIQTESHLGQEPTLRRGRRSEVTNQREQTDTVGAFNRAFQFQRAFYYKSFHHFELTRWAIAQNISTRAGCFGGC